MKRVDVVGDDRFEQLALVAEVGVEQLLVCPGCGRDPVDPGARDSMRCELGRRSLEDPAFGVLRVPSHPAPSLEPSDRERGHADPATVRYLTVNEPFMNDAWGSHTYL